MSLPSKKKLQYSAIIFSILFFLIFSLIPILFESSLKIAPIIFSLIIFFIGILSPFTLVGPYLLWLRLGEILGKLNFFFIMIIFFYVVVTPFAIIRRIVHIITRKSANMKKSSYNHLKHQPTIKFSDQF